MMKIYKVGGAVRDELLGLKAKDQDFSVDANSYSEMVEELKNQGAKIYLETPEFFTVRCKHPDFGDADFVLCRKEGAYSDSRHPDEVAVGDIYDDLARRDFTCNAMAIDMSTGVLLDPYNGVEACKIGLLQAVRDPKDRFREDSLRMLRAIRFNITKGFDMDVKIISCLMNKGLVDNLDFISVERIHDELNKCFNFDTLKTLRLFNQFDYLREVVFSRVKLMATLKNKY